MIKRTPYKPRKRKCKPGRKFRPSSYESLAGYIHYFDSDDRKESIDVDILLDNDDDYIETSKEIGKGHVYLGENF